MLFKTSLVLAFAAAALAGHVEHALHQRTGFCTSDMISSMNVASGVCTCRPHYPHCLQTCTVCNNIQATRHTANCDGGCNVKDEECKGCGVWFHTLCDCLQHANHCKTSATVMKGGPMIWALLDEGDGDNLVVPTDKIAGILQMSSNPSKYEGGWTFAQQNYEPKHKALVLNSDRAKTMEQLHIHVCNKTTHGLYDTLTSEAPNTSADLKQLKGNSKVWCMTSKSGPVTGFATAIHNFIHKHVVCDNLVGAGIMHDNRGYTWACATTDQDGPLGEFCPAKPKGS